VPQEHLSAAFRQGLEQAGYVEGRNVSMLSTSTVDNTKLAEFAAEFVRSHVDLIVASGNAATGLAARAATSTIPIVFVCGEDPVKAGLVTSLSRPSGNMTGVSFYTSPLGPKRMELLHELLPHAARVAVLANPKASDAEMQMADAQAAASALGLQLVIVNANSEGEIDQAFVGLPGLRADALMVASDPFLFSQRDQIVAAAARMGIVGIYNERRYIEAGGLLSYGTNVAEIFNLGGIYTGRVLGGVNPSDLPVVLPSRFELLINLKAAKALGLDLPTSILLRADEVIE
jgi:putative ABC transport system substrate-binding protein